MCEHTNPTVKVLRGGRINIKLLNDKTKKNFKIFFLQNLIEIKI